ncbi:MAG: hypothetical protein AB1490_02735 [Pseudomonadota bacterium]
MKKPKRQSTKLQKTDDAAAAKLAYRRKMNTGFLFWTVCSEGPCRRAKRCAGDGEACFQRWWPHVPEEFKQSIRAAIDGLRRGLSPEEAVNQVESKLAEWNEIDARMAQEEEEEEQNAKPVVREPVIAPAHGPRVRSL